MPTGPHRRHAWDSTAGIARLDQGRSPVEDVLSSPPMLRSHPSVAVHSDAGEPPTGRCSWHRGAWVVVAAGVLLTVLGGACGHRRSSTPEKILDTAGIPLSSELRVPYDAGRTALDGPQPRGKWARDLDLYHDLVLRIQRIASRQAAGDELYARWHAEPMHFLWIELAARYNSLLRRTAERNAMYALPVLADTLTPVGAFVRDRRFYGYGSRGSHYRRAGQRSAELDSLQQVWLTLKLALVESDGGDNLAAVARLRRALPLARATGGCRLEGMLWGDIATALAREDRLDDALHAAALAGAMAERAGYPQVVLQARLTLASILEGRREYDAALRVLDECIAAADAADFPSLYASSIDHAASLCSAQGDHQRSLAYDKRNLAQVLANRDSINIPRIQMSIAHEFRKLGRLDSCLTYQRQAQASVAAFPNDRNRAFLPAKMAAYYCHIGDYATADSLLDAARTLAPGASTALEEAGILAELLAEALETGQADLAYRTIARLQVLRPALQNTRPDQNRVADFEIASADFLARQGEFRLAAAALERALVAIRARGGEDKEWEYWRSAGELSVWRGDLPAAQGHFTNCLEIAQRRGDVDLLARSRFHLGSVLLEAGRWSEARALFADSRADSAYGGRFRTRLSSLVFLGTAWSRAGNPREALRELSQAEALCTERTPADLVARLRIEIGRAHAALGDATAAERALLQALHLLRGERGRTQIEELRSLGSDAVRDATEALLALFSGNAAQNRRAGFEWRSFWLAEAARRGETEEAGQSPADLERRLLALTRAEGPVVAFFVGRERSFAWVIDGRTIEWRSLPGRREIASLVTPVVADMTQPARAVDRAAARALAEMLLGDLGLRWRAGATLHILADDLLFAVPWAALPLSDEPGGTAVALDRGPIVEAPELAACMARCAPLFGVQTAAFCRGYWPWGATRCDREMSPRPSCPPCATPKRKPAKWQHSGRRAAPKRAWETPQTGAGSLPTACLTSASFTSRPTRSRTRAWPRVRPFAWETMRTARRSPFKACVRCGSELAWSTCHAARPP